MTTPSGLSEDLVDTLSGLRKEVNQLATEDLPSVGKSMRSFVAKKMASNPYQTVTTALGIGFGLGALRGVHFKNATIRVAKLIAMKALSNMETQPEGGHHGISQNT